MLLQICDQNLSISFILVITYYFPKISYENYAHYNNIQGTFSNGNVWYDNCPQFISCSILLHLTHPHPLTKSGSSDLCGSIDWELSKHNWVQT